MHRGFLILNSPHRDAYSFQLEISLAGIPPNRPTGEVTTDPRWRWIWKNKKSPYEAQKEVEYGNLIDLFG